MYQKEIIYMGLYKDGTRIGSAGFVKVENRENDSRLYLKTQNIPHSINGRFPIRVYNGSGWKELSSVMIQDGGGIWEDELGGRADHAMLQVMLPGGYLLEGKSKSAAESQQSKGASSEITVSKDREADREAATQQETESRNETETTMPKETEVHREAAAQQDTEAVVHQETVLRNENAVQADTPPVVIVKEELPRRGNQELLSTPEYNADYPLKEDKWEQILDTYEQIHPYGDNRLYVKLEPKDFVILQAKYQHLVNNSFLLHGFYNYRYVILGKEEDYYLGVPGVFYEREKMVALMFGFEAFECPGGNVRAGTFGYYLRKVEL